MSNMSSPQDLHFQQLVRRAIAARPEQAEEIIRAAQHATARYYHSQYKIEELILIRQEEEDVVQRILTAMEVAYNSTFDEFIFPCHALSIHPDLLSFVGQDGWMFDIKKKSNQPIPDYYFALRHVIKNRATEARQFTIDDIIIFVHGLREVVQKDFGCTVAEFEERRGSYEEFQDLRTNDYEAVDQLPLYEDVVKELPAYTEKEDSLPSYYEVRIMKARESHQSDQGYTEVRLADTIPTAPVVPQQPEQTTQTTQQTAPPLRGLAASRWAPTATASPAPSVPQPQTQSGSQLLRLNGGLAASRWA